MEKLYKMNLNFGRQGSLEGVFIADSEKVRILIEKEIEVDFGEVLGKNSDVSTTINEDEIVELSSIEEVIKIVKEHNLENGYNPFLEQPRNFDHDIIIRYGSIDDLCEQLLKLEQ